MARSIRPSARLERAVGNRTLGGRTKLGSRCKRHEPRWPGVIYWGVGVVAGAACLVALGHLHGNPPGPDGGFPDPALATLAEPAVAAVASLAALVLLAWCVRGVRFEFLAWWPGRIVVQNFVANGSASAADVERLTTSFRDRLGMSHLQSPAGVPAPAEQGDFLDVLGRGAVNSGSLLGGLLTLLRAAIPTHAYEVTGALVTRDAPRSCGVTVHVVRLPGKGTGGHTVWDSSWDGAVRQAADHATAAILPRTRVCRSPWAAWRRYHMPPSLIEHYERAAECEHERRYDEALAFYYRALHLDPMNHGLRLQIGFLQEKLGLCLDALDTYENILTVAQTKARGSGRAPTASQNDFRQRYRRCARRDRDRTLLVARYRHAVLLGGPGLPHQWHKRGDGEPATRRDQERERLRERLTPALQQRFKAALASDDVTAIAQPVYKQARRKLPAVGDCSRALNAEGVTQDPTTGRLAQLLLLASLHELAGLQRCIPPHPRRRLPLTRAAVRVSSLVVSERLRLELGRPRRKPVQIANELEAIEPPSGFERWQEHYNAACIYALPLLKRGDAHHQSDVEELTRLAVERLERATERGDSAFLVSRRDWVVSEDPDLQGLRAQPQFKRFEAAYFPSATPTPQRPRDIHKWEVSRYTLDLLRVAAQRWEDTWASRAGALDDAPDDRLLLRWCEDELRARRLVRHVALNHRDWRTRFELLERMQKWSLEYGFEPVEVAFPDFSREHEFDLDDGNVEQATLDAIEDKDVRLRELVDQLEQSERDLPSDDRQETQAGRLCSVHTNLWRRLGELVTPDEESDRAAHELTQAVLQAAGACTRAERHFTIHGNGGGAGNGQPVPSA